MHMAIEMSAASSKGIAQETEQQQNRSDAKKPWTDKNMNDGRPPRNISYRRKGITMQSNKSRSGSAWTKKRWHFRQT